MKQSTMLNHMFTSTIPSNLFKLPFLLYSYENILMYCSSSDDDGRADRNRYGSSDVSLGK